jgi:hypothetical protein
MNGFSDAIIEYSIFYYSIKDNEQPRLSVCMPINPAKKKTRQTCLLYLKVQFLFIRSLG